MCTLEKVAETLLVLVPEEWGRGVDKKVLHYTYLASHYVKQLKLQ